MSIDGSGKVNHFHEEMRRELGFAKFLLRSTFEKRSEGYVWDDCCRIGAEVFVHKGQTKTFDEYLPPRELKNPTSSVRKFRLGSISSKRDPKCLSSDKFYLQRRNCYEVKCLSERRIREQITIIYVRIERRLEELSELLCKIQASGIGSSPW